jgi:hypothetical protein
MKKSVLATAIAMALGNTVAQAAQTFDFAGTFTFYDASGVKQLTVDTNNDGTNDSVDTAVTGTFTLPDMVTPPSGQFTTSNTFSAYTWVADVDTMFFYDTSGPATQTFSYEWTNHTYSWNGVFSCRTGVSIDGCAPAIDGGGTNVDDLFGGAVTRAYSFDLTNEGQFGAGVFFDWSVNKDIPVLAVLQITNDPMTAGGVMMVSSIDGRVSAINPSGDYTNSPDGNPGNRMIVGPFPNQTPAFGGTMTPQAIPVPAAVWLFGSGLLGLVGVARRKKKE